VTPAGLAVGRFGGVGDPRRAQRDLLASQEKLSVARGIQQRFYPEAAPSLPGLEMGGASYPAEAAGGDYFDYLGTAVGRVPAAPRRLPSDGDLLLLITDGGPDTHSPQGELFEIGRTLDLVQRHRDKSPRDIVDTIYAETRRFAEGAPRQDDVTAVVVKVG
jgi:serine phosphatase RsbU (regulator of sigma subunit)